jgi:hypothetical protein
MSPVKKVASPVAASPRVTSPLIQQESQVDEPSLFIQSPIPIIQQVIVKEHHVNTPAPNQISITIEQFHQSNRDLVDPPLTFTLLSNNTTIPLILNQSITMAFTTPIIVKINGVGESTIDTSVLDYLPSIYGWYFPLAFDLL